MQSRNTTKEKVEIFENFQPYFSAMSKEIADLAKKKHEAIINEKKVKFVNARLQKLREVLKDEPEFEMLELLDDETLPQFGDVVLVLSQYRAAMNQFRERYYDSGEFGLNGRWKIE